jgi:hypothetical protein
MARLTISWLVRACGLLGLALLGVGLFLPFITTIDYFDVTKPYTYVLSFGGSFGFYTALFLIGPVALVALTQFIPAPTGSRRRGRRVVFILSLILASGGRLFFLLMTRVLYCIFYCAPPGPWTLKGVRMIEPGFWVMLAGYLTAIVSSLLSLRLRSRAMTSEGSPQSGPLNAPA